MARIYGTSKVWGEIKSQMENIHLAANHPRELEALLESCISDYEKQLRQAHNSLDTEISLLEAIITKERDIVKTSLLTFSEGSSLEIEQAEANLDLYKHDANIFNFIRNYFRVRRETRKLTRLQDHSFDHRSALEAPLQAKEVELAQKKAQKNDLARRECQDIIAQIEFLKNISGSQELATAVTELDLIELLSQLPANFHVFNDVELQVDRGFLFEGQWLIKSQIDQLVVTPSGLFAIEVKNWSKQLGDKPGNPDPYKAIKLAAQLCYELIKTDFPGITVRSILAYRGHPPEDKNPGLVKALPLQEVPAYISWFSDSTLTNQSLKQLITRVQEIKTN